MTLEERVAVLERQVEMLMATPNKPYGNAAAKLRWRLVRELPELWRRHPEGVTAEHVTAHFGMARQNAMGIIRDMHRAGKIQWIKRPGFRAWIILPAGAPLPQLPPSITTLSMRQQSLLATMRQIAINGRIEMSLARLGVEAGMSRNTVFAALNVLAAKNHVTQIRKPAPKRPAIWQVKPLPVTDDEVWHAAFKPAAAAKSHLHHS